MIKLLFRFECLDGYYILQVEDNCFSVETSIDTLNNVQGETNDLFYELLNNAHIERWDKEYTNSSIKDCTTWYVKYENQNKVYISKGEESCIPYEYNLFIDAIKKLDNQADYFVY